MRWSDIYIKASAMVLGRMQDTAAAVADGRYDPDFHLAHDYLSVSVAEDGPATDMAVQAARDALSRSGVIPADIRLVIHASGDRPGPQDVLPASYIQGKTVGGPCCALEVHQACNGALAALELASAYLAVSPAGSSALLTTSDKITQPDIDRYSIDPTSLPGDAATGLVLARGNGVARLLATAVIGDGRFSGRRNDIDPRDYPNRQAFLAEQQRQLRPMLRSMSESQRQSVKLALADAELDSAEISRWVFPNVGSFMVDREFRQAFGIEDSITTWDWGRTVGHLGAGNQIAGFTHLLDVGAVHIGDRVALCGNGIGFSYGCAIVEIVNEPEWSDDEKG